MAKRSRYEHPILYGTLVVGTFDLLDAFIFFGLRSGATPGRILQSIAAGVYGRGAARMGIHSMGAGFLLHYLIACLIVSIFYAASRAIPFLRRQWPVSGIAYGIAAYFVMNDVVLPLSAAGRGPFVLPVFVNGIVIHALGVGLPAAWFARE
jgi:hypothetical protein